ncbi:MAG: low molecular weight phosphotyrosine protein phosphatase [Melioribacteraceae bacterium]|nr:low molecular weight phosphotyrosine protein phosphatase [Melioribacteraceae bacterium]
MINVVFVCQGNICRSPSAEAVMNAYIKGKKLDDKIKCDSAGTSAYHVGEMADSRMKIHAVKRNYNLTSRARQFVYEDFTKFDYIIAMDRQNYNSILHMDHKMKHRDNVSMMTDYCTEYNMNEVPDPYYGGNEGFELVLDLLEDACTGFLNKIIKDHNLE